MTKSTFNCTQQELYTVCNMVWQSVLQNLAEFTAFKTRYTTGYVEDRLDEVLAAQNLPDAQARGAQSEIFRIQLENQAAICLSNWQRLKRYIVDAYEPSLQKPNLEAAGQNYYAKAGSNNWEAVTSLLQSGSQFLDNNATTLQANDNMPETFPATFNAAKSSFIEIHMEFMESEQSRSIATETKTVANNDIYAKVMGACLDGQEIYKSNEVLKKQFVFDQVLSLASGVGSAGLKGTVTAAGTENPVVGAILSLTPSGRNTATDEEGKYNFTQLPADDYTVTVAAEGYQAFSTEQTISTGTTSTLNIELTPIP